MKIIDLLVKISKDEKMPKKIKYGCYIWKYDKDAKDYYRTKINEEYVYLFQDLFKKETGFFINNEVEIIEEPKKLEKIDELLMIEDLIPPYGENEYKVWKNIIIQQNKINKLIEEINKLKGEE